MRDTGDRAMMFEHPDDEPILVLGDDQCWKVLENTRHGRLGLRVNDELDLVPVNFVGLGFNLFVFVFVFFLVAGFMFFLLGCARLKLLV
jgi:hypothetical protein